MRDAMRSYMLLAVLVSFVAGGATNRACAGQPPAECRCDPCSDPCPTSEITHLEHRVNENVATCDESAEQVGLLRAEFNEWRLGQTEEEPPSCPPCVCDCGPSVERALNDFEQQQKNRWYHTIGVGGGYGEGFDGRDSTSSPRGARLAHLGFIVTPARWVTVGASYGRVWDQRVDSYCVDCQATEAKTGDFDLWLVSAYLHPWRKSK